MLGHFSDLRLNHFLTHPAKLQAINSEEVYWLILIRSTHALEGS